MSLLPTVDFCGYTMTRLIIGGNPFRGNSHVNDELNADMREFHTVGNVVRTLLRARACGINTMQSRGDETIFEMVDAFREAGGQMHWIVQTASEKPDLFANIRDIAARDPVGIYWHGSNTDAMWKAGRIDEIRDYLKAIRDTGKLVGIASHIPKVLRYIETNAWDVDFYMVCLYNLEKVARESALVSGRLFEEPFDDEDRETACDFIRDTNKPCIAYKVLGASRKAGTPTDVREAFQFVFDRIKPGDVIDVGMFQKYMDQVAMNCAIVSEILTDEHGPALDTTQNIGAMSPSGS